MKKLVLLDGHALLHRAYHALPATFTDAQGHPTNALFGFASMLLKIIQEEKPDYLVAAFDHPGATFRHAQLTTYKEGRPEMEAALSSQIPKVKEMLRRLGVPFYEIEGFEGEDLLGSILAQIYHRPRFRQELSSLLVSGDRDSLQLVTPQVKVLTPKKGLSETVLYDEAKVQTEYGLTPAQIIDFKGLRGDPSDRLPGVYGVGEKTAVSLLQKYGTLEEVYRHLREVEPKLAARLASDAEAAALSKKLATISREAPLKFNLAEAALPKDFKGQMMATFARLGFKSLVKRLGGGGKDLTKKREMKRLVRAREAARHQLELL
jgi:DNA polymerase-1